MKETTTSLAPVRDAITPLPINGVQDLITIGQVFEQSGMFGCSQQGQGLVLAMTCHQSGMTPLQFIERYHIVEGRPTMRADAMLARLLELGGTYEVLAREPDRAIIKAKFRAAEFTASLNWQEAQLEPFTKNKRGEIKAPYSTPRSRMQMLWARVVSDAVRTVCPLANFGAYTPEEVSDFELERARPADVVSARTPAIVSVDEPPAAAATKLEVLPPAAAATKLEVLPPAIAGDAQPAAGESTPDFSVMPMGKFKGKAWSEFTDNQLANALKLANAEITDGHKVAIQAELTKRQTAGAQ